MLGTTRRFRAHILSFFPLVDQLTSQCVQCVLYEGCVSLTPTLSLSLSLSLARSLSQAAVLGVNDPVWGEKIGAILVLSTEGASRGADAALGEIKKWMEKEVAAYKVPRVWLLQ